jgi:DNA polymerase III epsilon subunit family exonuclease
MLPLPAFAFVDLETTGTRAAADRITEIGIVRVESPDDAGPRVTEWSSLVDPEVPIPPAIQALTGITNAMVAAAPTFSRVATDVLEMLSDCVFVAHNARFDYGFLKHAFARLGKAFSAKVLCTVRLSRRLFPDAEGGHGLDALIARHGLAITDRHRALGDARAIWSFVELLYRTLPAASIDAAIRRLLRMPSLPPQLAPDALDALPEAPGVYVFYGDNPLPLYIGKSVNLRERVAAHFSQDWRSETDLRLSREITRIEHEETAGELGALLREAVLVKSRLPAHNRALRRKHEAGVGECGQGPPRFVPARRHRSRTIVGRAGALRFACVVSRGAASGRARASAVRGAPRTRAACDRPVLRASARALSWRVHWRGIGRSARRAARAGPGAAHDSAVAPCRSRLPARMLGRRRAHRRPCLPRLVLAWHGARRGRARRDRRSAAACAIRWRRHAHVAAASSCRDARLATPDRGARLIRAAHAPRAQPPNAIAPRARR